MGTPRALRVALIQAGRIVEDRTFTGREKITVGTDAKSTFLVPMADVPVTTAVFDLTKKGAELLFDGQTSGRVSIDGAEAPLQSWLSRTSTRGAQRSLPLPADAKGRVTIGEVSLLFQFVDQPKARVPAELPKGARGLVAQLDRSFLVILAVSLAAHFAGAGYLKSQPVPEERDLTMEELVTDRWASMAMERPKPKVVEADKPAVADAPKPKSKSTEPVKVASAAPRPTAEALKERVRSMGIVGIIGSTGDKDSGFGDLMKDTGVGDIATALRDARDGLKVASVDDATAGKRKGNETGGTSEIERVGTDGVKDVLLNEQKGPAITGRVTEERLQLDTPEIDELSLTRWLQGRKPAIQSCYERELKRTPKLEGRLVIKFAITNRGRVGGVGFSEDTLRSQQVQLCISALMRGWVLPFSSARSRPGSTALKRCRRSSSAPRASRRRSSSSDRR